MVMCCKFDVVTYYDTLSITLQHEVSIIASFGSADVSLSITQCDQLHTVLINTHCSCKDVPWQMFMLLLCLQPQLLAWLVFVAFCLPHAVMHSAITVFIISHHLVPQVNISCDLTMDPLLLNASHISVWYVFNEFNFCFHIWCLQPCLVHSINIFQSLLDTELDTSAVLVSSQNRTGFHQLCLSWIYLRNTTVMTARWRQKIMKAMEGSKQAYFPLYKVVLAREPVEERTVFVCNRCSITTQAVITRDLQQCHHCICQAVNNALVASLSMHIITVLLRVLRALKMLSNWRNHQGVAWLRVIGRQVVHSSTQAVNYPSPCHFLELKGK